MCQCKNVVFKIKVNLLIEVASRLVRFAGWRQPFFLANRSSNSHRVQPKVNTAKM